MTWEAVERGGYRYVAALGLELLASNNGSWAVVCASEGSVVSGTDGALQGTATGTDPLEAAKEAATKALVQALRGALREIRPPQGQQKPRCSGGCTVLCERQEQEREQEE